MFSVIGYIAGLIILLLGVGLPLGYNTIKTKFRSNNTE